MNNRRPLRDIDIEVDIDYFEHRTPSPEEIKARDAYIEKWPPGYWGTYETLKAKARGFNPTANILVCLDGHFEVRFNERGNTYVGGRERDRHAALNAFIAGGGAGIKAAPAPVVEEQREIRLEGIARRKMNFQES